MVEETVYEELDAFIVDDEQAVKPFLLSQQHKSLARLQFLALCWSLAILGWNDGSTGPLLPQIQKVYNVTYGTVSWLFVVLCIGAVLGGLVNMPLNDKLGFGKMIVLGAFLQSVSFTAQAFAPPFFLFVMTFFVGGIGMSIQDAQANAYMAMVQNDGEIKMGILQAAYGAGALIAPLSATHFAHTTHWSSHYLISLVLSISSIVFLVYVFRLKGQDECLIGAGELVPNHVSITSGESKYSQMLRVRAVHLLSLFLLVYIGVEVTIAGWTVTFMTVERDGGTASGYVTSGFFAGLTAGRVILIPVTRRLGEKRATYTYTSLAFLFQVIVWLVPSMLIGSITVCLVGLLLGPMYPIVMRHAAHVIPRPLVNGSIGWITACGAAGGAVLPFFAGSLAARYGIVSLQPFLVLMLILMGTTWIMVPKVSEEEDE